MSNNKDFKVGLFDELDAIYPDTNPSNGSNVYTISAANNTYAGVHIMLSDLVPGQFITIEVFGPNKKYKLFELLPLPVEVNTSPVSRTEWTTGTINTNVIRRAPFMIYDVLKPCTNVIKANGEVAALAFRCKAEANKNECQKWDIIISHNGTSKHLTFLVEMFAVTINDVSKDDHKYVNWISSQSIVDYHNAPLHSDKWYEIFEKYLRLAKYGRQNMVCLHQELFFDYTGGIAKLNEKKLDKLISILDKVGIYWIEGGHFAGRKDNEWEATLAQMNLSHKIVPGDGEIELTNMGKQIYNYLTKNNIKDRWIQSFMDEPLDCLADTYHKGTQILKKAMPGIKILEATKAQDTIVGTVDYWCPTVNEFEINKKFFDDRTKNGDNLFVYTCLDPGGNYCNRLLDQERLRAVYIGWAPAKYTNIDGFLHWGGMSLREIDPYYLSAPLTDISDYGTSRKSALPAGDPAIMFPGFNEVYSSTRLEAHRIGFEDLVMLNMLKNKNPEKAKEIIACVFSKYDDYVKDINVYRNIRRKLMQELS